MFQLTSIVNANRAGRLVHPGHRHPARPVERIGWHGRPHHGIHVAHEQDEPRSFVTKRGKALVLTLGAIVFLSVVIFDRGPSAAAVRGRAGHPRARRVRHRALAAPGRRDDRRDRASLPFAVKDSPPGWLGVVTPGAVVATVGWVLVSALFAVYTANFSSYSKTYGALASIVVLLLWLWLSSLLVLVGAEVDGAADDGGAATATEKV